MESSLAIFKQDHYDRFVFVTYDKEGKIIGLNFHQGCDELLMQYSKPCIHLTEIFNRLRNLNYGKLSDAEKIEKAIELFIPAFILQ
jgi:hypothetical protein